MLAHFLNKYLARIIVLYVTARYEQREYACAVHHSFKSQLAQQTKRRKWQLWANTKKLRVISIVELMYPHVTSGFGLEIFKVFISGALSVLSTSHIKWLLPEGSDMRSSIKTASVTWCLYPPPTTFFTTSLSISEPSRSRGVGNQSQSDVTRVSRSLNIILTFVRVGVKFRMVH